LKKTEKKIIKQLQKNILNIPLNLFCLTP